MPYICGSCGKEMSAGKEVWICLVCGGGGFHKRCVTKHNQEKHGGTAKTRKMKDKENLDKALDGLE